MKQPRDTLETTSDTQETPSKYQASNALNAPDTQTDRQTHLVTSSRLELLFADKNNLMEVLLNSSIFGVGNSSIPS